MALASKPPVELLGPTTPQNLTNFLALPRELRDEVYEYLLSTEYNKSLPQEPSWVYPMRYTYNTYHLHPSILYTNRQINDEASQRFHKVNFLVRIRFEEGSLFTSLCICPWALALACYPVAWQSEHYSMEVDLLSKSQFSSSRAKHNIIITHNELPAVCRDLLQIGREFRGSWASMELRLSIGDSFSTADGTRTEGEEATGCHGSSEDSAAGGDLALEHCQARVNDTPSPRVRKLLEPFRRLHGIDLQIMGSVPSKYKAEIIAFISRTLPSNQELFDHVLTKSARAISIYSSGDYHFSILALKDSLDELGNTLPLHDEEESSMIVMAGRYAGWYILCAYKDIEFVTHTALGWAYLRIGKLEMADQTLGYLYERLIDMHRRDGHAPPGALAILYHLEAQIREAGYSRGLNEKGCRSGYSHRVTRALREGLRHEPDNSFFLQMWEKNQLELYIYGCDPWATAGKQTPSMQE